jgi:prevent-host-death family protein
MVVRMGAREARASFAELLGMVRFGGQIVIVERAGKEMAAVIHIDLYNQLMAEREARFEVIDRIREKQPDWTIEEVEKDVAEAITAVRTDAARRS